MTSSANEKSPQTKKASTGEKKEIKRESIKTSVSEQQQQQQYSINCSISTMIIHSIFIFFLSFLVIFCSGRSNYYSLASSSAPLDDQQEHHHHHDELSTTRPPVVEMHLPTVSVTVLVRNKGYALPFFLGHLDRQTYPKDRMQVMLYYDDSIDNTYDIIDAWVNKMAGQYHYINFYHDEEMNGTQYEEYWTPGHFEHMMRLRQKMLDSSRDSWADFHFSIDADIILTEVETLKDLVMASHESDGDRVISIISPLLECTNQPSYANFWGDMTEKGYYKRSGDYFDIRHRRKSVIHPVPMVHTVFLVNLRHIATKDIKYWPLDEDYVGPRDDIIVFARSAQKAEVQMYIDNRKKYGYFSAPAQPSEIAKIKAESLIERRLIHDKELFVHLKLQAMLDVENILKVAHDPDLSEFVEESLPERSLLGFDKVYVINLKRREDRLDRMVYCLKELGVSWEYFEAVDGKKMTKDDIDRYGIKQLPGYFDPYHNRSLKYGEIGCFLSHYKIWEEIIEKNLSKVLIFEDDIRFIAGFKRLSLEVMEEIDTALPNWDLLYYGRKRMSSKEKRVENTKKLAHPDYTYWTLAYCITNSGARKLLAQNPLSKIVAVDEFIPIMFDRHPNKEWLKNFEPRDLIALSAEPLLVEPTHYSGEPNYFSDTEDSSVIEPKANV